ncbi:hypothetical protein C8F04DRAFT_1093929 [Mycena alexandri]|uniref:Uncharacterized protein n=1 Tax=Mycena alexandri TaxID=1745969 RepID=A0AAD6T039_9AGAR|nr:hypothetical protein C8F04DRAFT_1093929 [Mycena alexandri]
MLLLSEPLAPRRNPLRPRSHQTMLRLDAILYTGVALLSCISNVAGQITNPPFEWGFTGTQTVSTSLPSCQTFPITVTPLSAHGVPPFYMIAFAIGGAPITSFIGKNASTLSWQVQHPIGTRLLMTVIDSTGTSAGVDSLVYNVTEGSTTQCLPPAVTEPSFNVTSNVTDTLTTCEPWGLTIRGGTPPYNVTLAALNAPVITNVTLGPTDSVFTYIDRADPNTQMIASVSDSNGRWATGSPIVRTQGSSNVDCPGLVSSSSSASASNGTRQTHPSQKRLGIIVGTTIGVLVVLCGLAIWALRRQRQKYQNGNSSQRDSDVIDISPFRTEPSDSWHQSATIPPQTIISSKSAAQTQSDFRHMASFTHTAGSRASPTVSPTASPSVLMRELPPPYGSPQLDNIKREAST